MVTRNLLVSLSPCLLVPLFSGCTVGPDYHPPQTRMPANWSAPAIRPTTAPSTAPSTQSTPNQQAMQVVDWWTTFNDPTLNSLIKRAVESNLDLRQAAAKIRQARASRGVVSAGQWPTLKANSGYTRTGDKSKDSNKFQAGLDATWEVDIFGGVRRGVESAEADIQAAIEDRRSVLVTLASEVALNYMDLRGTQQQIAVANKTLLAQKRNADITRRRFAAGLVTSKLDLANADADVASTMATLPVFESSLQQSIYSLSLLLGQEPTALDAELSQSAPIPTIPPEVPIGLPSDLLRRRPDIRSAESKIHSATASIGVATADLFPKFTLTGNMGYSSNQLRNLLNWSSRGYSAGPSVDWLIFSAGRISSNIEVQKALRDQALIGYQKTVLTALNDVQSALVAYEKEQQHRRALLDAVANNRQAVELATTLYSAGQTDFLNVLTAQRSLFATEDALVRSTRDLATDLISLYKALGGGWESAEPAPATQPAK